MVSREGLEDAAGPWEAFALAAVAPLGPFSQVHLAPKLPPSLLNAALASYLSRQGDELLLALIDAGARESDGCCALTTRRIYWAGPAADDKAGSALAPLRGRTGRRLVCQAADYGGLPDTIAESGAGDESFRFELGGGRTLSLKHAGAGLARALARYLETMGTAARTGITPSLIELDPQVRPPPTRAMSMS